MPRVSIAIPADILAALDETAEEMFSSRSAALRLHWKRYMELRTDENTIDTVVHGTARECTGPTYPDPVRAPEHSGILSSLPEEDERAQIAEAAELLTTLDWHGAGLPKNTTPAELAESLVTTYPEFNVPACIREAHSTMLAKGKAMKALGRYLNNWMKGERNPPAWVKERLEAGQLTMLDKPTPLDASQAHSGAYDENGRWTKDIPRG